MSSNTSGENEEKATVFLYYVSLDGKHVRFMMSFLCQSWWRHEIETFSALLAICAGNSPVTGEFSAQRPMTRSFDIFFDLRLNKRLSKQWRSWWFETPSRPLWHHYNDGLTVFCPYCSILLLMNLSTGMMLHLRFGLHFIKMQNLHCSGPVSISYPNVSCVLAGCRMTLNWASWVNLLWRRWRDGCSSTLAQMMACYLTAPSHYPNCCVDPWGPLL